MAFEAACGWGWLVDLLEDYIAESPNRRSWIVRCSGTRDAHISQSGVQPRASSPAPRR
jgi:hypothetical protein